MYEETALKIPHPHREPGCTVCQETIKVLGQLLTPRHGHEMWRGRTDIVPELMRDIETMEKLNKRLYGNIKWLREKLDGTVEVLKHIEDCLKDSIKTFARHYPSVEERIKEICEEVQKGKG